MNITDINCMLGTWPSQRVRFENAEGLLAMMDSYRINTSIAFHSMSLWSPNRGNNEICKIAEESSGRIKACFILDPSLDSSVMPDAETLVSQLKEKKPAAVKLYSNPGLYHLDEFYCGELLDILNGLSMPILFDSDQMPSYDRLPALAKRYSSIKFILLRRPFNESRYILPLIKKLDNVFFDMSILVDSGMLDEIVNKFGSSMLLFGSGMPFYVPSGALGLVMYSRVNDIHKEKILSGNWDEIERGIRWE